MWVYQSEVSAQPIQIAAQDIPAEAPGPELPKEANTSTQILLPEPLEHPKPKMQLQKDCWLLASAFLLGTAAAGILRAFCEQYPQEWLQFYLQSWQNLFTGPDAHTAAALFCIEYLTLAASATVLLLLGFSALGPVLIFLFAMFYGLGNGTMFAQVFSGLQLQKGSWLLLLVPLPSSVAAAGLCLLGASALQVSARIRAYSFFPAGFPTGNAHTSAGSVFLVRSYLLAMVLFLPLCGISAALAGIGSRL